MGTTIELTIEGISLDGAKNHMGNDYGFLFQEGDSTRSRSDQLNCEYLETQHDDEHIAELEEAFARPLSRVLPRLNLLGSSLNAARTEYDAILESELDMEIESSDGCPRLTFEEFCSLACRYRLQDLKCDMVDFGIPDHDRIAQGRLSNDADLRRTPWTENSRDLFWSEASYFTSRVCILSPASMLQIFGLNAANAGAEVMWQFGPLVNSGWEPRESFQPGARRQQTILVATEGASDARILKKALARLRPEVSDFFRFIDVDERHHFWGTGNLVKFAEGLLRIDVQNQVLFLLDNDAEGVDAYRRLRDLSLPSNMRATLLPTLDEFRNFPARGPEGVTVSDINGRAAAIECYLDLNLMEYPPAQIIWSNYKKEIDAWHGVLEHKESYMKYFLNQEGQSLQDGSYDISKLTSLLDTLIAEAAHLTQGI